MSGPEPTPRQIMGALGALTDTTPYCPKCGGTNGTLGTQNAYFVCRDCDDVDKALNVSWVSSCRYWTPNTKPPGDGNTCTWQDAVRLSPFGRPRYVDPNPVRS